MPMRKKLEVTPEPQDYLTERGKELYHHLVYYLTEYDLMFEADSLTLSAFANSLDLYAKYAAKVNKNGAVQVFDNKTTNVNGYYTVMQKELRNILTWSIRFGLDQSSREKIFGFHDALQEKEREKNKNKQIRATLLCDLWIEVC